MKLISINWISVQAFPDGTVVKHLPADGGDVKDRDSVPGWGRCPRGGHGGPLQYCLGNRIHRGAWWAAIHGVTEESKQQQEQ